MTGLKNTVWVAKGEMKLKKVQRIWILVIAVMAIIMYPVKNSSQVQVQKTIAEKVIPTRKLKPKTEHWKEIQVVATAYCNCKKCTGWGKGITASGVKTSRGVIAAPRHIPFNTVVKLENLGSFVVKDRGGAIKVKNGFIHIDVWMPSHQEAVEFGKRKIKGWIKIE